MFIFELVIALLLVGAILSLWAAAITLGAMASLQHCVVAAQRQALMDLTARDIIGDAAFQAAEEELDLLELTADPRVRPV